MGHTSFFTVPQVSHRFAVMASSQVSGFEGQSLLFGPLFISVRNATRRAGLLGNIRLRTPR
jgi:hypothetical protein